MARTNQQNLKSYTLRIEYLNRFLIQKFQNLRLLKSVSIMLPKKEKY